MGWSFRKSKKIGPFRVSVGKTGFSTSFGVKGARVRVNSRGRVYGSVGAGGFRMEQRLDGGGRRRRATPHVASVGGYSAAPAGCFAAIGVFVAAAALLICSGILLLPPVGSTPNASGRLSDAAADETHVAAAGPPAQNAATSTPPITEPAAPALVAEVPPDALSIAAADAGEANPAAIDSAPAVATEADPLGPVIPASPPELNEQPRPWVDATGKHSVVATLAGLDGDSVLLRNAEGRTKAVPLAKLSAADAAYARLHTAPRVTPSAEVMLGTIVGLVDGDTVRIRTIDEETKTVRLEGIDAPEAGQPFGTRAKERLGKFVFQKDVRIEVSDLDRYGRYLGQIYLDGRWVNRALLRSGMAWHYREYSKDPKLAEAESLARKEEVGVWSSADRVAPWDWRRGTRESAVADTAAGGSRSETISEQSEEERTVYVTSSGSKYHRAGCQYLAKSSRAIPYSQAQRTYSPCSRCRP